MARSRTTLAGTRVVVSSLPFVLAIALAGTACGAGESPRSIQVERVDSAGIEVVTSPATDFELQLDTRRLFTLGGKEEGPESFYFLPATAVGSDDEGRIYVLDFNAARVVVFGPEGELIRTLGRDGGGPGEFQAPNGLSVTPEGVISVFDFGKGGLVRFDADGTVLPEISFQEFPASTGHRHFAVVDDGIVVSTMAASRDHEQRTHQLRLHGAGETATLAELLPVERKLVISERCGGGIRRPPVFSPDLIWDARGGRVVTNAEPGYSVLVYEAGRASHIVRRPLPTRAATGELALAELGDGLTIDFGRGPCNITARELLDGQGYAATIPLILDLRLAPDGTLWTERRDDDPVAPPRIDLFDPSGAYLGTLPRGTPFPVLLLPDGKFAIVEKDEFDVARLVVMKVE